MQTNEFLFNEQVNIKQANRIDKFLSRFNVATLLNRCRIRKAKGFAAKDIFVTLFAFSFLGKDFYHGIVKNKNVPFGKDAI